MSKELQNVPESNLLSIVNELDELQKSETGLKLLTAKSLGLTPFESITGINIIQGKPTLSSAMQNKILRNEGWDLEIIKDVNDRKVTVIGRNAKLNQEHTVIKSIDWAKGQPFYYDRNGQVKILWKSDPLTMLMWRAVSEFYRLYSESTPLYETQEIKDLEDVQVRDIDNLKPIEIPKKTL